MKTHILFSYKNWKNELRGVVDNFKGLLQAETSRATESEQQLKQNVQFLEDEVADAFSEIAEERRRVTAEVTRATATEEALQSGLSAAKGNIARLTDAMTLHFDGVLTASVNLNSGVADSQVASIWFYVPLGRFIAKTGAGTYYTEWEGSERYMSDGAVRGNRVYISGDALYVWNGGSLVNVVVSVANDVAALLARVKALEDRIA